MKRIDKVLIVEDEAIIGMELRMELLRQGVSTCLLASNSEKAIALARQEAPDLIIMDVHLADGCDGIETARLICEQADIPLIMITGYVNEELKSRMHGLKPLKIFIKPFIMRELVDFIRQQ